MTAYLPGDVYRAQSAALTRAVNSGDPDRVIRTITGHVQHWEANGYAWPDSWHRWNVALQDAVSKRDGWQAGVGAHLDDLAALGQVHA